MNRADHDALASAGFTAHEDGGVGGGDLLCEVDGALHFRGIGAGEVYFGIGATEGFLKGGDILLKAAEIGDAMGDVFDLGGGEGLGQVIGGTGLHGLHGGVDGCVRGDDDDFKPGAVGQEIGNQVEAAFGAEAKVDE